MKSKTVKLIGLLCTVVGAVATIGSNWATEKQMDETISKKVSEALASKEN